MLLIAFMFMGCWSFVQAAAPPIARPQGPPTNVKADPWSQAQANIQRDEYNIAGQEQIALPDLKAAYKAPNRAQGFRTCFTDNGIRVVPRTGGTGKVKRMNYEE